MYNAFPPLISGQSDMLILGTFPSPISRKKGEYYGNPQNKFWKIIFDVSGVQFLNPDYGEKKKVLLNGKIALWDVIEKCGIIGAADTAIKKPVLNIALLEFIERNNISTVVFNGQKAYEFYRKGIGNTDGIVYNMPVATLKYTSTTTTTNGANPVHDDNKLFEMLILEDMQAGLSWLTVLKKREAFRLAFDNFDPYKVALYDDQKRAELMANEDIIRNRLKINAAIVNAKLFLKIQEKYGSFDKFIWSYVDYKPIVGNWTSMEDVPVTTDISDKISKDLKKMGFKFVGSTIIYSFMQAVGMVNDHTTDCFMYREV